MRLGTPRGFIGPVTRWVRRDRHAEYVKGFCQFDSRRSRGGLGSGSRLGGSWVEADAVGDGSPPERNTIHTAAPTAARPAATMTT